MDLELRDRGSKPSAVADHSNSYEISTDDRDLIRLGKRPVLKRNFGFMSILGFSCTVLITWEGIMIVSTQSLVNGGPGGVLWGYLIVWLGSISTYSVLSELASMAPTSGGQYHWVAMLSPESSRNFLSYITGWMTFAGWQAVPASAAYLIGSLLQSVIMLFVPDYIPQPWQTMMFLWVILAFAVLINTVASKTLSQFEGLILVLHILGFFAILIPFVYLAPHGDSSVFTTFLNGGGWPTMGLSFMVGLPASVFSLVGADSAVHMAEEIKNASVVVPRAVLFSLGINGILGLAMLLAYLLCLGDIDSALEAQYTLGYPFLQVFWNGTGSRNGAGVMGLIIVILGICSTVGVLASSSRMLWSFARDRGVPFWKYFVKLHSRTAIPIYTVGFTTLVSVLLSLITLGSSVAFSNIVNLSAVGLYSSYLLCCALLLWRRLQPNGIRSYNDLTTHVGPNSLQWGPWRIPGIFGIINNSFACIYLFVVWFFAFWPPTPEVTPESMNFSALTWGGTLLFAIVWYFAVGRKEYTGPVVEIQL